MSRPLVILFLLLAACGPKPPATISVESKHAGVYLAALRAAEAWCEVSDRTGWCPEIVDRDGDLVVKEGHWDTEYVIGQEGNGAGAHHDDAANVILVSKNLINDGNVEADYWTGSMVHEFGHCGIDNHYAKSALMKAQHPSPWDVPWEVDDRAVEAWCEEQGCP